VHILLTNDDGVLAPGLLALKTALDAVGRVTVFAPDHNWSAAGHTKTMHKPLRADRVTLPNGDAAFSSTGAPSDCVALAVLGLVPGPIDLVVSGINRGPNVGHDITYSGTVAAAMEGVISEIPSLAVSLDVRHTDGAYAIAATFAARLAKLINEHGLPPNTFLNVNVPDRPAAEIQGVQVTRLGRRIYRDALVARQDPRGRDYYWIGGEWPESVLEEGTDMWALAHGYISVTPIHLDMTAYDLLDAIRTWPLESCSTPED